MKDQAIESAAGERFTHVNPTESLEGCIAAAGKDPEHLLNRSAGNGKVTPLRFADVGVPAEGVMAAQFVSDSRMHGLAGEASPAS